MTRLVLASASPRRRALLVAAGRPPDEIVPADLDETPRPGEAAAALARRLATAKRDVVLAVTGPRSPDAVVLAADTVVSVGDRLLGKPRDDDEATAMLTALAGTTAHVDTGVAVGGPQLADPAEVVVRTDVRFRDLDPDAVRRYVATGEPRGVAGAFRLQGAGATLVAGTDGCPTNVVGLPVCETARLLRPVGVALDGACADLVAAMRGVGRT